MALWLHRLSRFNTNFIFSFTYNVKSFRSFQYFKIKNACNLESVSSSLFLETPRRNYSLMFYSQHVDEEFSWNNMVAEYIKSENKLPSSDYDIGTKISNIFDSESAIKQFQSIILHSLETHPDEVIKLFSLYKSYSRSKLNETLTVKASSNLMELKIQTTILSMTFDQLYHFATALKNLKGYKLKILEILSTLVFEECLSRAENCQSLSEAIQYFMIGYHLFGGSVSHQNGYFEFMTVFQNHIEDATPSQLCQILYFCGLAKKVDTLSDFPLLTATSLLSKSDEISFLEFSLAVNGMFKLNLKLDDDIGDIIKKKLIDALNQEGAAAMDSLSAFALVSSIKYLRFIVYSDKDLMNTLNSFIKSVDKSLCNPQFISHIIAMYANSNYYDPDVYSVLSSLFFEHLRSSSEVVRIKDISRVLWSLSHAQHKCKDEDLELLEETLYDFCCSSGELLTHASHAVDSTLYLASLDVYSEKLMKLVLQPQVVEKFKKSGKTRFLARLLVLLEVRKTFLPSLETNLSNLRERDVPFKKMAKEFEGRPSLVRLQNAAYWLRDECRTRVFYFKLLVPHINYYSMIFCNSCIQGHPINASDVGKHVLENLASVKDTQIAIDVNDETTCINDGERVNGLEALKRKLLKKNGWDVKVLSSKDIEKCGNDDQAVAALILKSIQE